MKAVFVELPAFAHRRAGYLSDDELRIVQVTLMTDPESGDVMPGTGGLRKLRVADARRGKGRRGGLRVVYFWWSAGAQFWLFTLFDKDEMSDLGPRERGLLRMLLKAALRARSRG